MAKILEEADLIAAGVPATFLRKKLSESGMSSIHTYVTSKAHLTQSRESALSVYLKFPTEGLAAEGACLFTRALCLDGVSCGLVSSSALQTFATDYLKDCREVTIYPEAKTLVVVGLSAVSANRQLVEGLLLRRYFTGTSLVICSHLSPADELDDQVGRALAVDLPRIELM